MKNPKFTKALQTIHTIYDKKNADYSENGSPYSNFEHTAQTANLPMHKVFLVQIGNKIARINELMDKNKTPNNEAVTDSLLDLATYSAIFYSYYLEEDKKPKRR